MPPRMPIWTAPDRAALLDGARERRAVMVVGAEIVGAGVAMGVDVHHADRPLGGDRAQDRQRNRMVAAGGKRNHPGGMDAR